MCCYPTGVVNHIPHIIVPLTGNGKAVKICVCRLESAFVVGSCTIEDISDTCEVSCPDFLYYCPELFHLAELSEYAHCALEVGVIVLEFLCVPVCRRCEVKCVAVSINSCRCVYRVTKCIVVVPNRRENELLCLVVVYKVCAGNTCVHVLCNFVYKICSCKVVDVNELTKCLVVACVDSVFNLLIHFEHPCCLNIIRFIRSLEGHYLISGGLAGIIA